MRLHRRKRPLWEHFVVWILVGCSMILGVAIYAGRDRLFKERLLILELEGMRRLVVAQMLEKRAVPKIPPWSRNPSPQAVDPFGKPYDYNPESGRVNSRTEGYGSW